VLLLDRASIAPASADGSVRTYPITFHPASRRLETAAPVSVDAGRDLRGIDIRVTPVAGTRLSGRLDGSARVPLGLSLRLMLPGTENLGGGSEVATTSVEPDGRFTCLGVPPGDYTLDASRTLSEFVVRGTRNQYNPLAETPNFNGLMTSAPVRAGPAGTRINYRVGTGEDVLVRESITVREGGAIADLTAHPRRGAVMVVRVAWDGPALNVRGVIASPVGADSAAQVFGLLSSSNSDVTLAGLQPGRYNLSPAGGARVKSVICGGQDMTNAPIAVLDAQLRSCEMTLTRAAATVTGSVFDPAGQPAADAGVIVFPVEPAQWSDYGPDPARIRVVPVDYSGKYAVSDLPAGEYYVAARPLTELEDWQNPDFLKGVAERSTPVHLDWGAVVTEHPVYRR
jgi:hypothetical protein